MLEAGIVGEDEPLELLAGELVLMSPQNPRHAALTEKIRRLLERYHQSGVHTRTHSPLEAAQDSLPEPDVGLYHGSVDDYLERHPGGHDAMLVVEIAATSRAHDRAKAGVYSRAGVPVYWLVDLQRKRLEERSQPKEDGGYGVTRLFEGDDNIPVPGTDEQVAVAELLA